MRVYAIGCEETAHHGVVRIQDLYAILRALELSILGIERSCPVFAKHLHHYRLLDESTNHYDGPHERTKATNARFKRRITLVDQADCSTK